MKLLTDRSRLIEYQRCPRGRWAGYERGSVGIMPVRRSMPLTTGTCVHEGLARLLQQPSDIEGAVQIALSSYARLTGHGLGDADFVEGEQGALIEALIRAYHARCLSRLLDRYRVLEVEHEDLLALGTVRIQGRKVPLTFMARPDALLQDRESGDLYIQSFKTAAAFDRRREAEAEHDVQGLSESTAVEARFRGWAATLAGKRPVVIPEWFIEAWRANDCSAPRIMGIRMEYLLKGERRESRSSSGLWVTSSPLIRGWRRPAEAGYAYAWRYEWTEADLATGGSRSRRLGRDWQPFNIWEAEEIGGVKGWIEMLAAGKVQPEAGDCLGAQFVVPVPHFRQQTEMEDWFEQAAAQEARVAKAAAAVRAARTPEERRRLLNRHFPQHRRACDWPTTCPFQEVCFGSDVIVQDPVASGLYIWREPHHEAEREQLQLPRAA